MTRFKSGSASRVAWLRRGLALVAIGVLAAGCGDTGGSVDPLLDDVAKARDAQALSSLQQALTAAALVRAEAGGGVGSAGDLVQRLQARDPSKRFTTASSRGPDEIQVAGGGSGPLMLVARSPSGAYLAVWDGGGSTTFYYRGEQPPQFSGEAPAGSGWSSTPPL